MATLLKLGPADHGRPLALEEFLAAAYADGFHYELIEGKLCVSPAANAPEGIVELWILLKLWAYANTQEGVINYAHPKARVFLPEQAEVTAPEPDVAAYRDFPMHLPIREIRWEDTSPLLVVEVLSAEEPAKDLERNVNLYLQIPSIKEYWIFDTREDPERMTLYVYRRRGRRWQRRLAFGPDAVYATPLLPGFQLVINPRT